jgi:hypothetical protein
VNRSSIVCATAFKCLRNVSLLPALLTFLLQSNTLSAQLTQPLRFEAVHKSSDFDYIVLSMKEHGLALMHQIDKYKGSSDFWEIILLDSALKKIWSSEIELNNQLSMIGFDYINKEVFFLFRMGSGDQGALHLIEIDVQEQVITKYVIEPKLNFKLAYFNIIGRSAVLAGYVARQPTVFLHGLNTGRSKVVPGFFMKNTELLDIRANLNGTFNTLVMDKSSSEKNKLVIKTLDESGTVIIDDAIDIDPGKSLLSGVTSTLLRDDLLVTGTWGLPNGRTALGIYTVLVDPFNKETVQYYDFSEFNHFLDFNSSRKAARIKAKANRRKKAGKLPSFSVYVNTARLAEHPDGFIVLSEVYTPNSTQNSYFGPAFNSPYGYTNALYPQPVLTPGYGYSPSVFNSGYSPYGYGNQAHRTDVNVKFASVAIIDSHGRLLEDTGMKIDDVRLPSLDQVSDFNCTARKVFQVYRNDKQLNVSTTVRDQGGMITSTNAPISLLNTTDILRTDEPQGGSLRHWYDDYFFVWGYETIKEKEVSTRNVFYVNKLKTE